MHLALGPSADRFPVASLGTRFLPATKAIPKEMQPIIDPPLIQYAVGRAEASRNAEHVSAD